MRLLLASMPFYELTRPALGPSLLKAAVRRAGHSCDVWYGSHAFAAAVGADDYQAIARPGHTAGDLLFAEALNGPCADRTDELILAHGPSRFDVARVAELRRTASAFVARCVESLPVDRYDLVGFSSIFVQNVPSLALARALKRRHPALPIVFGGPNWEGEMGEALLDVHPFVDLACSGEADESFPALLATLEAGDDPRSVPGVIARDDGGRARLARPATPIHDMDSLPVPDFDDYFRQFTHWGHGEHVAPRLSIETSRGCWWGERSHCTFCGLNASTMAYRSKSPDRVFEEIRYLRRHHLNDVFEVTDNILDMRYLRRLLPRLADEEPGLGIFWEVKANLTHRQLQVMRRAGVVHIQPGIESLSDHVLTLMKKGTTGLQNIQLLKWATELGIRVSWNLLVGFSGERPRDYAEQTELMTKLAHLEPPGGVDRLHMERFSPYFTRPAEHGVGAMQPHGWYRLLYPFDDATLARIAYFFDWQEREPPHADIAREADRLRAAVDEWHASHAASRFTLTNGAAGRVHLVDDRPGRAAREITLHGWEAAVYLHCDRARSDAELAELPALQRVDATELNAFLERCADQALIIERDGRHLALAVHTPPRLDQAVPSARRTVTLPVRAAS